MVYLLPENNNNSWDGQCVGYDIYSINVSLLPLTVYHLRIVTFTIARLNNAYGDIVQMDHVPFSLNSTELYFELTFTTKDVPGKFNLMKEFSLLFFPCEKYEEIFIFYINLFPVLHSFIDITVNANCFIRTKSK